MSVTIILSNCDLNENGYVDIGDISQLLSYITQKTGYVESASS